MTIWRYRNCWNVSEKIIIIYSRGRAPKLVLISMENILLGNICDSFQSETTSSDRNYGQSSGMTNQISSLTEQSFPEICRNDQSLNETIWTPKGDKLHVFDMVKKMKRKKFVHWILSLHATKFYEAKVNSFCKGKWLIKTNVVQTQLWEKPIYKVLSCFRKQKVLSGLFTRNFFLGKKGTNPASQNDSFCPPLTSM